MYLLKQPVSTITYQFNFDATFKGLISRLRELQIDVLQSDEDKGEIVARCLSSAMNMIVWRCWSDKILFELKKEGPDKTRVDISALPNLFRIKVRKNERVVDLDKLVSQLSIKSGNG
jgi:hypothetical protein